MRPSLPAPPFGARRYCSFVQVMTLKPQYAQFYQSVHILFRCAVVVCHILHVVSLSWHCAGSVRDPRGAGHNNDDEAIFDTVLNTSKKHCSQAYVI